MFMSACCYTHCQRSGPQGDDLEGPQRALGESSAESFSHFEASLAAMDDLGSISSLQKLILSLFGLCLEWHLLGQQNYIPCPCTFAVHVCERLGFYDLSFPHFKHRLSVLYVVHFVFNNLRRSLSSGSVVNPTADWCDIVHAAVSSIV